MKKINVEPKWWIEEEYPITIIADRYGGCYSKAAFTCWPLDYYAVPAGPDSSDVDCVDFWKHWDKNYVGFGSTPDEALNDLRTKLRTIVTQEAS